MKNTPATSIEFWCVDTTVVILKRMADEGIFSSVPGSHIKRVHSKSIIPRYSRRPSLTNSALAGERSLDLPGFVVTYLGHKRPVSAGENCSDDGKIDILIQLVDEGDDSDYRNASAYLNWISEARTRLQDSGLENCPKSIGQVYHTHVTDHTNADETDWAMEEQMRMALRLHCFTRTHRKRSL